MTLKDLETRGFTVVPGFLSADEVSELIQDFNSARESDNQNYRITFVAEDIKDKLISKITPWMTRITDGTGLVVDIVIPCANYMDTAYVDFGWHQDHESYYSLQQHYNYLNFYIPIIKPDSKKTGMSLVPFDLIPEEYASKLIGSGATGFDPTGNSTRVVNDDTGEEFYMPLNIVDLAVSPELMPGDLLIMRGDVIHRTQDQETHRVAVSIRGMSGDSVISLKRIQIGPARKLEMISNNQKTYDRIFEVFKVHGDDTITAREFCKLKDKIFFGGKYDNNN